MRGVLIQHGSGICVPLLAAAEPWHRRYCAQHDYESLFNYDFEPARDLHPVWNKIALLLSTMHEWPAVPLMFVLDADALIVHKDVKLEDAIGTEDIGLVRGDNYVNSGFMVTRNTEKTRVFWNSVYEAGPVAQYNHGIDARLFMMLHEESCPVTVKKLGSEWNYFERFGNGPRIVTCEKKDAHIQAWHGQDRKSVLAEMQKLLGELN